MKGSLYLPGTSWMHRARAGHKLLALALFGTLMMQMHSLALLAGVAVVLMGCAYQTGIALKKIWDGLRPIWIFMLVFAAYTAWLQSPELALQLVMRVTGLMTAALLVSMTTPITQMMAVLEWVLQPLARLGWVNIYKVSLVFGLTMRLIPELSVQWHDIREAQSARGIEPGVMTMLGPMLVRTLRRAEEIAEAIDARGVLA